MARPTISTSTHSILVTPIQHTRTAQKHQNAPHNSPHGPRIPPIRHHRHPNGKRQTDSYIRVQISHLALELSLGLGFGFGYSLAQSIRGLHMSQGQVQVLLQDRGADEQGPYQAAGQVGANRQRVGG